MRPRNLFILTFIAMIAVYLFVLGQEKTIELFKEQYLLSLALIPLSFGIVFFKFKLKDYETINFNQNATPTLKTTVLIFLVFSVVDYISEDGFIGMISQWLIYWIMGVIAILLIENLNYFRNYKLVSKLPSKTK